jgi:hypothetical protein
MKKQLLEEKKAVQIRAAIRELKVACIRISESASGVKPFRLSKLLNVMYKVLSDYIAILQMLVGDRDLSGLPENLCICDVLAQLQFNKNQIPCPDCDGSGRQTWNPNLLCPRCNGKGYLEKKSK